MLKTEDLYTYNKEKCITKSNYVIKALSRQLLDEFLEHLGKNESLSPLPLSKSKSFNILHMLNTFSKDFKDNKGKLINLEFLKIYCDMSLIFKETDPISKDILNNVSNKYLSLY